VRDEPAYFDDVPDMKISPDMLDLAVHILESKRGDFDPSEFEDRYETALSKLINAKRSGKPMPTPSAPPQGTVVNLMDALRRSLQAERGAKPAPSATERRPRRGGQSSGRRRATGRRMKRTG
jgi:DNA end-binding protein Ku